MTDQDLPPGVRLILIHALELCGAVLRGDPKEQIEEQATNMFVICSEHIEITE